MCRRSISRWRIPASGDFDDAFAALDHAWLDRDPAVATLDAEPRFEPLRSDPRYRALVDRIKIPRSRVGV
jgi:hypothetical protein